LRYPPGPPAVSDRSRQPRDWRQAGARSAHGWRPAFVLPRAPGPDVVAGCVREGQPSRPPYALFRLLLRWTSRRAAGRWCAH